MAGLLQDVRFALRQLRKNPGFTMTATAMLAVAICANSTVFSWIDGTMLHPIPGAQDTGDLVSVMRGEWNISPVPPLSYPDYRDLRDQNHSLSGILAYNHDWITLTGGAAAGADLHRKCVVELLRRAGHSSPVSGDSSCRKRRHARTPFPT